MPIFVLLRFISACRYTWRMRTEDVIKHFSTQLKTAAVLGINQSSVAEWGEFPPDPRQLQIEKITKGVLKAEPGCLDRILGMDKLNKQPAGAA